MPSAPATQISAVSPLRFDVNATLCPSGENCGSAQGLVCLPSDNVLHRITLPRRAGKYALATNPLAGRSVLTVRMYTAQGK